MAMTTRSPKADELIRRLDQAVATEDLDRLCGDIKRVLADVVGSGEAFVEPAFLRPLAPQACGCKSWPAPAAQPSIQDRSESCHPE